MPLINDLSFPFELKKDQIEGINAWINAGFRGSLIFGTGTGKTEMAFECAKRASKLHNIQKNRTEREKSNFNILFLVPRIVLIEQNVNRLIKYGLKKSDIGVFFGEKKEIKEITISTYQSISKNLGLIQNFDMIILDEVHLISNNALKFKKIFDRLKTSDKLILGLTATIDETDLKYSTILELIPPVKKYVISEAIKDGRLSKVEILHKPVEFTKEEERIYKESSLAIREISTKINAFSPAEISRILKTGGHRAKFAKIWFQNVLKRKKVLNESTNKILEAMKIIKEHPNEKILIFSETIEALTKLEKHLQTQKIKSMSIHNKIKTSERKEILKRWGDEFFPLLSVHTLEIGFDVPDVKIAIILANSSNFNQLVQRIGRVLRKANSSKNAKVYIIYVKETKDMKTVKMIGSVIRNDNKKNNELSEKNTKITQFFSV